jgi:hypothetical protein
MALAGNRRPVGFVVRRPLMLWGVNREVGEYIPIEEVESMVRLESMVRAGRFNAIYEEDGYRVERKRGSSAVVERTPITVPVSESDSEVDYPEDGTIPDVKDWVGDDLGRAAEAYDIENERPTPRVTLLSYLEEMFDTKESSDV